ncbi:uncharacterized protein LOC121400454 [Xenopus laevis]|uniref:Uncharacterized protein LOC121400454 n=1 Tax=Xenopus laevis TaxID=8355 RepID=A0A8J1MD89_XENLA|nr:uncharacterized protein LOC121400454 [Xenopus laevis]
MGDKLPPAMEKSTPPIRSEENHQLFAATKAEMEKEKGDTITVKRKMDISAEKESGRKRKKKVKHQCSDEIKEEDNMKKKRRKKRREEKDPEKMRNPKQRKQEVSRRGPTKKKFLSMLQSARVRSLHCLGLVHLAKCHRWISTKQLKSRCHSWSLQNASRRHPSWSTQAIVGHPVISAILRPNQWPSTLHTIRLHLVLLASPSSLTLHIGLMSASTNSLFHQFLIISILSLVLLLDLRQFQS